MTGDMLHIVEEPGMLVESCYIDEAGAYMTMLDENRKQANIYSFEWTWEVDKPNPPKKNKLEHVAEQDDDFFSPSSDEGQEQSDDKKSSVTKQLSRKLST